LSYAEAWYYRAYEVISSQFPTAPRSYHTSTTRSDRGTQRTGQPKDGPAWTWDDGTAYTRRLAGRQSGHSNQMLGVMPRTGWRAAGRWERPRSCGGGREPQGDQRSR